MKFKFWMPGFSKERHQPTQRKSVLYQPLKPIRSQGRARKRGSFAVRTLRELAGKNWKNWRRK